MIDDSSKSADALSDFVILLPIISQHQIKDLFGPGGVSKSKGFTNNYYVNSLPGAGFVFNWWMGI